MKLKVWGSKESMHGRGGGTTDDRCGSGGRLGRVVGTALPRIAVGSYLASVAVGTSAWRHARARDGRARAGARHHALYIATACLVGFGAAIAAVRGTPDRLPLAGAFVVLLLLPRAGTPRGGHPYRHLAAGLGPAPLLLGALLVPPSSSRKKR